jgi:hypothetical protein
MLPFTPGAYRGTGRWIDRNTESAYTVECTVTPGEAGSVVHTVKRLFPAPEGSTVYGQAAGVYEERSKLTFVPVGKNEFQVTIDGAKGCVQASAYCFDAQCHLEAAVAPGVDLEVTWTASESRLELIGSSTNNGNFTSWRETLAASG